MTEKRCGTCKWWEWPGKVGKDSAFGDCAAPLPESVTEWGLDPIRSVMADCDGTTCPTWEKRDAVG